VEVRRYPASAATGALIAELRENRGLRQRDIEGLSERHVRRIEQGIARLTGDSAGKLAGAFGLGLDEFLFHVASSVAADRSADAGVTG
jgi:transcriptional regulator with XRE-family HTH domain